MTPRVTIDQPLPPAPAKSVTIKGIMDSYDPLPESEKLKSHPADFETIRNTYPLRHEAPEDAEE